MSQRAQTHADLDDGEFDALVDHVANGGDVSEFCGARKWQWCDVSRYINKDPDRAREFESAKVAKEEWTRGELMAQLMGIATADTDDEDTNIRTNEKIRAIELAGKSVKLFEKRKESASDRTLAELVLEAAQSEVYQLPPARVIDNIDVDDECDIPDVPDITL